MILESKRLRLLGIDPSTTNMGVAVIDIDLTAPSLFDLVYVNTIKGDKLIFKDEEYRYETDVTLRSKGLAKAYSELLEIYQPDAVVCEDNFLGASPDTFKRLIEMVCLLRYATEQHNRGLHLANVLPNLAKAIVGANFPGTQKEHVLQGIKLYPRLRTNKIDLDALDDHSTDAIIITLWLAEQFAIGYNVMPLSYWEPVNLNPNKNKPKKKGKRRGKFRKRKA